MKNIFQIRKDIGKSNYIVIAIVSFILAIGIWTVLSVGGFVDSKFLPDPLKVIKYITKSINDGSLLTNMSISIYRIFMGFIVAVILGVPIGILVGTFKSAEAFIQPLSEFIRYMPVPAFVPLIMIWVGIGEGAKIAVIFIGTLFQLIPMIADNVRSVPDDLISAAYTLGAKRIKVIFKVMIPYALPRMMETLRMMIGWAWTYLVTAELVAANSGLGYSILKAQRFIKTDAIFGGILVIGLLGLITDRLFAIFNKVAFRWYRGGV